MKIAKFVMVISMLIIGTGNSADILVKDKTLNFSGSIGKKDFSKVVSAFAKNDIDTVVLNSGGGYLKVAIDIGRYLNNKDITTVIAEGDECASACGLIFLSGKYRQFDGKLGIHCSYIKDTEGCYMPGVDKMESFLKEINLSDKLVSFYIENAQQRKMKWFKKSK